MLAVLAANDLVRRKRLQAREIALYTALVTPAIAALVLVAERSSYELFGFSLTVLSLTVAHFHFAGFAAALVLLVVSAGTLTVTMLLALSWALGHVVATPYLPLRWMVATHGVANALGFALCGLLAWRRLKEWDEAR